MPVPDRSWTIAPALLWFVACLMIGLCVFDGGIQALADRLTTRRDGAAAPSGSPFAPRPVEVADRGDSSEPAPVVPAGAARGDHSKLGALEDVCLDGAPPACKRWGMDGFYRAIADSRAGKLGRAVRVSWYGDSVIATDAVPARLRARLQGELGDGGPGFVYVVPPHRFCVHEGVTRSDGGGWRSYAISTTTLGDGLYGVGGSTSETTGGRATIKLVTGKATQLELYYLAQPRGGRATLIGDGAELARVDTAGDAKAAGHATASAPAGVARLELRADGKLRLFGVALENATGAVVDNFGIVSVNVKSFAAHDGAHWVGELAHRNADLVMFMIGANEAQWLSPGDRDTRDYQGRYEQVLAQVRRARPDGACLVVSPTDQAEARDGAYPSRPVMPVLIEAQRRAARAQGCAFFSTYDWMGAKGSAARWFARGLVGSDFQHLSKKGATKLADALFDTVMAGYARYARP